MEHPRWLALLTLAFALAPVGLAVVTYRDARQKDERLFETSAEVLSEQLKRNIDSLDVSLSPEVMAGIEAIHTRYPNPAP